MHILASNALFPSSLVILNPFFPFGWIFWNHREFGRWGQIDSMILTPSSFLSPVTNIFEYFFNLYMCNTSCSHIVEMPKGWFPLTHFWLRTLTHARIYINCNHVNINWGKTDKVFTLNVKLSEVLLLRLLATFHTLPLYFICKRTFYACTQVKITRQWKLTLRE